MKSHRAFHSSLPNRHAQRRPSPNAAPRFSLNRAPVNSQGRQPLVAAEGDDRSPNGATVPPQSRRRRRLIPLFAVLLLSTFCHHAQALEVEAYAGQPFGVGRVTLPIVANGPVVPLEDERFTAASPDGRVLYPVLKEQAVRRFLRRLLEIDSPRSVTMYFLFTGDAPFELDAYAPTKQSVQVTPQPNPAAHRALMRDWWREYSNHWKNLRQNPQFPPVIENFLAANLSRRLNLALPEPSTGLFAALTSPKNTVWDDLFVTESHQLAIDQAMLQGKFAGGPLQPLPSPMPWYNEKPADEALKKTAVEPIAKHVPVEAFYLRFGTFTNYLWFRDLSHKWQGDLGNMIIRRAIDRGGNLRIQEQLSLHETALSRVLGPGVIADVAIIGLDPYLSEGGAVGILFQAKSNPLLTQDLIRQRREALEKFKLPANAAKETTVRIADRDVSLISTPGGEVRSYYIQDGDFHLVTTSARLIQRFLQAGQGDHSLASSPGFLEARSRLPLTRNDAIFAYVSPAFFRELTSPAIWIESQRRARSLREAKLLTLARLEAAAEGIVAATTKDLIAANMLPAGFGARADGSTLTETPEGFLDSRRGKAGIYLPVSEVEVASVTAEEAAAYQQFADRFRQEIGQTPPIALAAQRKRLPNNAGETIAADILATPLDDVKLGRLPDMLGEPSKERVAPVDGDVVHLELVLNSVLQLAAPEPHHLFVALRDFRTPLVVERGQVVPGAPMSELVRMYVGTWPRPGLARLFFGQQLAQGPEPIAGPQNTWQAKRDDFLLISFKPDLVREVLPQLHTVPVEEAAQIWLDVADLTKTQLSSAINAYGYARARETSVAACRLMNNLAQQLHLPIEGCQKIAQDLMNGRFVDPLGGEYAVVQIPGSVPIWSSTAITPQNQIMLTQPPPNFQLPILTWLHGLRGWARLDDKKEIAAHIEVDMAATAIP